MLGSSRLPEPRAEVGTGAVRHQDACGGEAGGARPASAVCGIVPEPQQSEKKLPVLVTATPNSQRTHWSVSKATSLPLCNIWRPAERLDKGEERCFPTVFS